MTGANNADRTSLGDHGAGVNSAAQLIAPASPSARIGSGRSVAGSPTDLATEPRGLFICSLGYNDGGLGDTVDARLGTVRRPGSVIPAPGALEVDVVERSDGFAMEPQLAVIFLHSGTIAHRSL